MEKISFIFRLKLNQGPGNVLMSFADADSDSDNETPETNQGRSEFLQQVLADHPSWIKTATVITKDGVSLRLLHIASSSTVISYDEKTTEKFYLPLTSPIVRNAQWMNGTDK